MVHGTHNAEADERNANIKIFINGEWNAALSKMANRNYLARPNHTKRSLQLWEIAPL